MSDMKKIFYRTLAILIFCASCNNNEANVNAEKEKYQRAKETLEEREKKNPVAFLLVNSSDKRNLIGEPDLHNLPYPNKRQKPRYPGNINENRTQNKKTPCR